MRGGYAAYSLHTKRRTSRAASKGASLGDAQRCKKATPRCAVLRWSGWPEVCNANTGAKAPYFPPAEKWSLHS